MKGNATVIEILNGVLTTQLSAINQYYIHHKILQNCGYTQLSLIKRKQSLKEMQHADRVIERILYLKGAPDMQGLRPVKVGEDPIEMHEADLAFEIDTVARLNRGIAVATQASDNGTRALLESILASEENALDWLEAQFMLVEDMGRENYLAQMIAAGRGSL